MRTPQINRIGLTTDGTRANAYAIESHEEDYPHRTWWAACQTCEWVGSPIDNLDIGELDSDYAQHNCKG